VHVAVFGATGDQGAAQVRALARSAHAPIALSRTPHPIRVEGRAIETRPADFADAGSVAAALDGVDAVLLNLPSTSFQAAEPLIAATRMIAAAAEQAGVRGIVFNTSMPVPGEKRGFAAQDARHEMRRILFASAIPTVSIQPVVFLDNLLKGWAWPPIAERGTIVYPHRETLDVSWICHDDLAALMIAAMERPHLAGRGFAVGGAETVRLPELARRLSRGWDRPLAYESQSVDDFCGRMSQVFEGRASLAANRLMDELHRIYTWYNESPEHPFKVDMAPVLAELPVTLTPIETWARRQGWPPLSGL
jgi:uncharacterized protein YbjT (DUF2867 family)